MAEGGMAHLNTAARLEHGALSRPSPGRRARAAPVTCFASGSQLGPLASPVGHLLLLSELQELLDPLATFIISERQGSIALSLVLSCPLCPHIEVLIVYFSGQMTHSKFFDWEAHDVCFPHW